VTAPAPQSGTNIAWMGGYAKAAPNTDSLTQDVAVPAGTTMLSFTGYYYINTEEFISGTYDRGEISLTTTAGAAIEAIKSLSDDTTTTAWTAMNHTFANLAQIKGQTVRLKLTTDSDSTDRTNFMFDSFVLTATVCP
jgi:xanthomonalisin